jgi:hypothetical protein
MNRRTGREREKYVMDDIGDPTDSLAAGFRGWGRRQHPSVACYCTDSAGASVINEAAEIWALVFCNRSPHRRLF